jgi:hypothetical protein
LGINQLSFSRYNNSSLLTVNYSPASFPFLSIMTVGFVASFERSARAEIQIPGKKPDGNSPGTTKIQLLTPQVNEGKVEPACNCIAKVLPAFGGVING